MANVNLIVLLGRLTHDPEARQSNAGKAICSMRIAVNHKWGETEETLFINVTVFGAQAQSCERYLSRGREVLVEGRLRLEEWTGQDGQKRSKMVVIARNVQFIGGSKDGRELRPSRGYTAEESERRPSHKHDSSAQTQKQKTIQTGRSFIDSPAIEDDVPF